MALVAAQFSRTALLNSPAIGQFDRSFLHYEAAADTLADVVAAGYFNGIRRLLRVGDRILVVGRNILDIAFVAVLTVPLTGDITTRILSSDRAGFRTARGIHVSLTASDTVVTGLATVATVVASLGSDPVAGCQFVSATIGDQAGAPDAGSIIIRGWRATATADTALIAANAFTRNINWIAVGT